MSVASQPTCPLWGTPTDPTEKVPCAARHDAYVDGPMTAAFRYPGFDVVYEGMMSSSIDDGGLEFRGTEATLKIDRSGFAVYREGVPSGQNPVLTDRSFRDGTISHMENFFECIKTRKEPNAPVESGVAAARAGHIGNLALHHAGEIAWPAKT